MKLNIWLHDTYQFDQHEYCNFPTATTLDGSIDNLELYRTTISGAGGSTTGLFGGQTYIRRHQSMISKGTMIKVHSRYDDAPYPASMKSSATFLQMPDCKNWYLDNRTTNDDDVCLEVGTKCLVIYVDGHIINSLSEEANGDYHGIGVVLDGRNDLSLNERGAIELGAPSITSMSAGHGAISISGCKIGIDQRNGVTRFKISNPDNPYDLSQNHIAVSVHKGTYVSKWADNISGVNKTNVLITLADPDQWHAGDVVFASGFSNETGSTANCALTDYDRANINFFDEVTMTRYMRILDSSVTPGSGLNDPTNIYPCIRLARGGIYNTRNEVFYEQLSAAVSDSIAGDELVYFGNVIENTDVTIGKNLTIRSANAYNQSDVAIADRLGGDVNPNGYIVTKAASGTSFITVTSGATVNLGCAGSGPLTFQCNGKGRGVDVQNGTLNIGSNATITGGNATKGGGIYADSATATVNLAPTGNKVYNNSASEEGEGDDIYVSADATLTFGTVADGLFLDCECSVIDGWYEDAADGKRWVGHSTADTYHLKEVNATPAGFAYALKAAHGDPSVKVNWKNYDGSLILSEYVKINTTPAYTGTTPYKPSTETQSFEFTGWDRDPSTVTVKESEAPTGGYVFTAEFTAKDREADIIFYDYDGQILQKKTCAIDVTPTYTGTKDPTRSTTAGIKYVWDKDNPWNPALAPVTDVTKTYLHALETTWGRCDVVQVQRIRSSRASHRLHVHCRWTNTPVLVAERVRGQSAHRGGRFLCSEDKGCILHHRYGQPAGILWD